MSRERNEEKKGLSPTQRKACVVLALCALAVVMSILAAWVLPTKLGLFAGGKDSYDPDAYPLDTTLDSILPQSAADDAYITASVFAGDQYAVTLQKDTRITLNQFVGQEGLQISKALSTSCVNFASDASSYTIPQAIPKMKARRVFVVLGANDVDGSVSVDSFIADYKQFLQSIRSAYAYCDIIAVGIPPVTEDSTNAAETQTRIDQFNQAIAAASILAKTFRDDYMDRLATEYPYYDWQKNKGYPTRAHREGIRLHGITPYHRKSYNLLGSEPMLPFDD